MPKIKKPFLIVAAFSAFIACVVIRFAWLFGLNSQAASLSARGAGAFLAACLAGFVFFALFVFAQGEIKSRAVRESKAVSVFSFFCSAGMFCDFVVQCLNCYNYASKSAYVALNRIIPIGLSGAFALMSAIYFIIIGISFSSSRYDFMQLKAFKYFPLLWALCAALSDLTEYSSGISNADAVLKSLMLLLALLFFFFFACCAQENVGKSGIKGLVFSGLSYGMMSISCVVPEIFASLLRRADVPAFYTDFVFLFSGIFALSISFYITFQKKD